MTEHPAESLKKARGPIATEAFEQVVVTTADELREWLERNHASDGSIWLVTYKKHCAHRYVGREAVLDELMCFGWIDGLRRILDADRTMQLISPRRQQVWAQTYKNRVARLRGEGRMRPAGEAAVTRAKDASTWDAMADVDALIVPPDLTNALVAGSRAAEYFDSSPPSYRRNVLRWIASARTDETRAKRVMKLVEHAEMGRRVAQL